MASIQSALICALLATILWSCIGFAITRALASRSLALALSPAMGWAVHSAIALPVFSLIGMSQGIVIAANLVALLIAVLAMRLHGMEKAEREPSPQLPVLAVVAATLLALAMMMAIMPRNSADGIVLAAPIFDHSKVAMVDEMARSGVPSANPFFGEVGSLSRLSYYYLWHFSAAELAVITGLSGWNADAGLTWFTAFASLTLMMGFATWFSGRAVAAVLVIVLAATESARPVLSWIIGERALEAVLGKQTGFAGWLFQATWATQHAASAFCVVLGIFLLTNLAQRPSWSVSILLGLVTAAGFESSTWIGGLVFPLTAIVVGVSICFTIEVQLRRRFLGLGILAAVMALGLTAPFLHDQYLAALARGIGSPVALMPYKVLGSAFPESVRRILDLPAYWLVFLVVQFPAFYPAGAVMARSLWKDRTLSQDRRAILSAFLSLALVGLTVAWLFASTIGDNNDLGWRASLPAILVLIVFAAAGFARLVPRYPAIKALAASLVLVGLIEGALLVQGYIVGDPKPSAPQFARSVSMWESVRKHMDIGQRVANNPLSLSDMTPWAVNISWALLADRRSCYAGRELALPFAPLPRQQRDATEALFVRVFSGSAEERDVEELATRYGCDVAVVTVEDGAWNRDPFADSSLYRLVEENAGAWRIYKIIAARRF